MSTIETVLDSRDGSRAGTRDKVCVVGAGSAGIAMCRGLAVRGIAFDCYERTSEIGGLWRYPRSGGSCAYASLFPNTSKTVMQYPSFPMPDHYPHYPHHTLVARYFEEYVDHYGFRDRIRFDAEVTSVRPVDGEWEVELAGGEAHRYRAVCVASGGRHAEPLYAELQGEFSGRELHAFDYDGPAEFEGQTVVVLGLGATSADVASEIGGVAARTYLSARTGHYVVPKLIEGRPIDVLSPLMKRLSVEQRRPLLKIMMKLVIGDMTSYGLPRPPYKPGQGPLIATGDLLPAIFHGRVVAKPLVERVDGRVVRFGDGDEVEADAIIHCTGYRIAFPFLDPELIAGGDDAPPLYHLVVPPEIPGLYFIGLLHSMMSLMPLAEMQGDWVGDLLSGAVRLPLREAMWDTIRRARRRQDKRFYDSSGHLLVDPNEYERLIARERRRHAAAPGAPVAQRGSNASSR